MTNEQFEQKYYPKYAAVIRAIARKVGQKNDSLVEDLEQEGAIALWQLDVSKAKDNEDSYIRQAIKFRMIDFVRKERPGIYESLSAHLDKGDQLIKDAHTGEMRLLSTREKKKKQPIYEDDEWRVPGVVETTRAEGAEGGPDGD